MVQANKQQNNDQYIQTFKIVWKELILMPLFRRNNQLPVVSKEDALSFIEQMKQLAEIPGSNVKGMKITRNGKNQIIGMRVISNSDEMGILRKRLKRESKLFTFNRRF